MKEQRLTVYPGLEHGMSRAKATQGEVGVPLVFDVYNSDGSIPDLTGAVALLHIFKFDRNVAVIQGEAAPSGGAVNTVTCTLTYQATMCPGTCSMFLQILTDAGDLRYDNMELLVTPADIDGIVSRSDFGPLTSMLQSSAKIQRLLEDTQDTAAALRQILDRYTAEISPAASGALYTGSDNNFESQVAFDAAGNLLFLDLRNRKATETRFSPDFGKTWEAVSLPDSLDNDLYRFVIGGDRYLLLGDHLVWLDVQGGTVTAGEIVDGKKKNVLNGRYLNGKYFVFWSVNFAPQTADPPCYYTGNGGERVDLSLPDSNMAAHDIAYDAASGTYYLAGGYLNGIGKSDDRWLLSSINLTQWTQIATWTSGSSQEFISLRENTLYIYGRNYKYCRSLDLTTRTIRRVYISDAYPYFATSTPAGDILFDGQSKLLYTKDGETFKEIAVSWAGHNNSPGSLAVHGSRIAISSGGSYALYQADIIADNLGDTVASITQWYAQRQADVSQWLLDNQAAIDQRLSENQAAVSQWLSENQTALDQQIGRKLILTTTDPGIGASAETGAVYFVYEEG